MLKIIHNFAENFNMDTKTSDTTNKPKVGDWLPLNGTDYVEFYVGNAKQAAYYYQTAFGFQPLAYSGLETGNREFTSYVLEQGKVRLILTTPMNSKSAINQHIVKHGDGVKTIAFWVDDSEKSFNETVKRGAKPFMKPTKHEDENGHAVLSGIHTYGDTIHLFVERKNYKGIFLPGFKKWETDYKPKSIGFQYVDHMVGNVSWGEMNTWVKFYEEVLGFYNLLTFDDKDISTEYSALMSKVMSNGNGYIKFPINEPAEGKKKSQIEEYIDFYEGQGCQHVALATNNIIETVTEMRKRGVEFLHTPDAYYDTVLNRVGKIDEDINVLKNLRILIDKDEDGYLLQIFTKPVEDRPTLFYEIIQRKGAKSFGKGNFQALFESIEREQAKRGNL